MLTLLAAVSIGAAPPRFEEWKSEDAVAWHVAKLFPGAKSEAVKGVPGELTVGPLQRGGLWGYARTFQGEAGGGVGWASFELRLAKLEGAPPRSAEEAVRRVEAARQKHLALALIALDGAGKVIGKPEGWPIETDLEPDCGGDLCALSFSQLTKMAAIGGREKPVLAVDYVASMTNRHAVFAVVEGKVRASTPIDLSSTDPQSDCAPAATATSRVDGCTVVTTVEGRCPFSDADCRDECAGEGFTAPTRTRKVTALEQICR